MVKEGKEYLIYQNVASVWKNYKTDMSKLSKWLPCYKHLS